MISEFFPGKVLSWCKDSGGRIVGLLVAIDDIKFNFVNVYTPTNLTERKSFFKPLHQFFFPADFLIVGGDSNCYERNLDKFEGNISLAAYSTDFRTAFFNLIDIWPNLHPHLRDVSWFNSDFSIGSHLDKFWISKSLVQSMSLCTPSPCCFSVHDFVNVYVNLASLCAHQSHTA